MYTILVSEFKLQILRYSSSLAIIVSFLFGVFLINNQTPDVDIMVSGPFFIIKTFALQLLIIPGVIAMFAHRASIRDFEHNMDGLVYSSTTRIYTLIAVRLLVLILLNCFVFFAFGLGLITGLAHDPEASLSLGFQTLSWILVMLVLPNTVLISTVLFVIGLRSKHSIHIYIAALAIFFAYQFVLMAVGSPLMASNISPNKTLVTLYMWLDPYGLGLYFEHVKEWSIEQKNEMIPGFSAPMIMNRLVFFSTTTLVAHFGIKNHLQEKITSLLPASISFEKAKLGLTNLFAPIVYLISKPIGLFRLKLSQTLPYSPMLIITSMAWQLTIKTKTFLLLNALLLLVIFSEVYFGYTNLETLGTQAVPTTLITVNRYLGDILPQFCGLFIVLLCSELCWRDSSSKIKQIVDCTPVSNRALFFGRMLAVSAVPIFFVTVVIAVSLATQTIFGGKINLYPYLLLYPYVVLPLIILGVACIVINHLSPNKYWALSLTMFWYLWTQTTFPSSLGLEHPLWALGLTNSFVYSDLTQFEGQLLLFWDTNLLRGAVVLFGCIVCLKLSFFRENMLNNRSFRARRRMLMTTGALIVVCTIANLLLQTHYFGSYQSSQQRHQWKADYEARYKHLQNMTSLRQTAVNMNIDVHPEKGELSIEGEYKLENTYDVPVSELFFNTPKPFIFEEVVVENGLLKEFDAKFDSYLYRFSTPVNPGETVNLRFKARLDSSGYEKVESDKIITNNYVYIRLLRYLPWIGYVSQYELKDNNLRRQFGLAPTTDMKLEHQLEQARHGISPQYNSVEFEATITTSDSHTVIAPGELIALWEKEGRRGFRFKSREAIPNLIHFISTNMPRVTKSIGDTNVNVLFPAGKRAHGEKHLEAILDAITYGNKHFGHYEFSQFNLVPSPVVMSLLGYALPQTVFIGEAVGFHVDFNNSDGFDNLYRRTVHEVSHQWWGYHLNIGDIEGSGVLAETLAKYTELVLLRKKYGKEYVKRLVAFEQERYFEGRSRDVIEELPLYLADSAYLIYSKGSAAMHAILELLGEEKINQALSDLLRNHRNPATPATTRDLIHYLSQVATEDERVIIDMWFKEIQVNDLAIENVSITPLHERYKANICVRDLKKNTNSFHLTAYDFNEDVIGIRTFPKKRLDSSCVNWVLTSSPKRFEIDANLLHLDSNRDNNKYEVPQI